MSTALVVSGGGFQGLALVKALQAVSGTRVLVADSYEESIGRFAAHGFHRAPLLADAAAFEHFLFDLCENEAVDAVFPATDFELDALAAHRAALETRGTRVWVSSPELLALARHKGRFYAWLRAQGLPVLPSFDSPLAADVQGPLIGKPAAGWGGRDMVRVSSAEHAAALPAAQRKGLVWQRLLPSFEEYSIDFSVNSEGRASPLYQRRRLRTTAGFAVLCEPTADPLVHKTAHAAVAALARLGALGVLNLQILVAEGQAWISDLNPRVGTSMPLTLAAGGNPVAHLLGVEPGDQACGAMCRTVRTLRERCISRPALVGIRGVVFDLDDTLFDQKDWIVRKLRLLWQVEQDWLGPQQAFLRAMLQILEEGERGSLFDVFARREGLDDVLRQRLIDGYRRAIPAECRVYADVAGTLAQLRRRGLRLGLLTDNPPVSQRQKIECAGLATAVDAIVLTGEIGHGKPDPAAFHAIADGLRLQPEGLVMVGDNLFRDSLGALDAGFAHAFHIQRPGGFFNFDLRSCAGLLPAGRCTTLHGLHELDWYLDGANA